MSESAAIHHDWEEKVGQAPYRLVTVVSFPSPTLAERNPSGYQIAAMEAAEQARGLGVHLGICDICGMGLMNNYVCQNSDGGRFVVGCDCATHLHDARLSTEVQEAERKRQRELARQRLQERWEAERITREAAERERNGGLTDREIEAERRKKAAAEAAAKAQKAATDNAWLIAILEQVQTSGDFIPSMIDKLNHEPVRDLSDRCITILSEIYAKHVGGRKGSKAYKAAEADFYAKAGAN